MKYTITIFLTIVLLSTSLGVWLVRTIGKPIIKQQKEYEEIIGERFLMKGDTVQVVNSSQWNSEVTLDNNLTVSYDFIKNCKKLK